MPISKEVGASIPNNTPHAVSVTLPTWEATVAYEESQDWVVTKMTSGYPRFFIHSKIQELSKFVEDSYGRDGERAMIFTSSKVARKCREYIKQFSTVVNCPVRILQLTTPAPKDSSEVSSRIEATVAVVFFPSTEFSVAKSFWQHSGEGISSRMGEYIYGELKNIEKDRKQNSPSPGPNQGGKAVAHYNKVPGISKQELQQQQLQLRSQSNDRSFSVSSNTAENERESSTYVEEKFGRNLDLSFAKEAKIALRRRISGSIGNSLTESDVYLYPTGMASIFGAHQALLSIFPHEKSVCFGFPYVDTLNILRKFGPGVHFYGFGDDESLEELESKLRSGMKILALFCECPSNPLLKTPNLKKIRKLADEFGFAVVVDETVGNFLNVHVAPYADIIVSSLTKVFSGDSNVMGGSLVLNPDSRIYKQLKTYFNEEYEDLFWAQDALYLERNSRDFVTRSAKINDIAASAVELLSNSDLISKVYYPSTNTSKKYYDEIKTADGGYGGLLSFVFKDPNDARCFFNIVELSKGPSLGTNFTIASPYAILAHFNELDEVEKWGVDRNLIRISVGLEGKSELLKVLSDALECAAEQHD